MQPGDTIDQRVLQLGPLSEDLFGCCSSITGMDYIATLYENINIRLKRKLSFLYRSQIFLLVPQGKH